MSPGQMTLETPPSEPTTGPRWRVVLDTGRFGDWLIVRAPSPELAIRGLTRWQRSHVQHVARAHDSSDPHPDRKEEQP